MSEATGTLDKGMLEKELVDRQPAELCEMARRLTKSSADLQQMELDLKEERQQLLEENEELSKTISTFLEELKKLNIGASNIVPAELEEGRFHFVGRFWERVKPRDSAYLVSDNVGELKRPEPDEEADSPTLPVSERLRERLGSLVSMGFRSPSSPDSVPIEPNMDAVEPNGEGETDEADASPGGSGVPGLAGLRALLVRGQELLASRAGAEGADEWPSATSEASPGENAAEKPDASHGDGYVSANLAGVKSLLARGKDLLAARRGAEQPDCASAGVEESAANGGQEEDPEAEEHEASSRFAGFQSLLMQGRSYLASKAKGGESVDQEPAAAEEIDDQPTLTKPSTDATENQQSEELEGQGRFAGITSLWAKGRGFWAQRGAAQPADSSTKQETSSETGLETAASPTLAGTVAPPAADTSGPPAAVNATAREEKAIPVGTASKMQMPTENDLESTDVGEEADAAVPVCANEPAAQDAQKVMGLEDLLEEQMNAPPPQPQPEEQLVEELVGLGSEEQLEDHLTSPIVIEASIAMDDGSVQMLRVRSADRCKEVAKKFVQEHSLKVSFEAPIVAWLKKVEADAMEFPVCVKGDLLEIWEQRVA